MLSLGADPNVMTEEGETPLSYAAEKGKFHSAEILLAYGADAACAHSRALYGKALGSKTTKNPG